MTPDTSGGTVLGVLHAIAIIAAWFWLSAFAVALLLAWARKDGGK